MWFRYSFEYRKYSRDDPREQLIIVDRAPVVLLLCAPCRYEIKVEEEVEVEQRWSPARARNVGGSRESLSLFLCDRDRCDYDYHVEHAGKREWRWRHGASVDVFTAI